MEIPVRVGDRLQRVSIEEVPSGPRVLLDGKPVACDFRAEPEGIIRVRLGGEVFRFSAEPAPDGQRGVLRLGGFPIPYRIGEEEAPGAEAQESTVRAHMPGLLVSVAVRPGDRVGPGTVLAVLEAMKMQNEIRAKGTGCVAEILVTAGSTLEAGQPILRIA